jgi:translation initiation factor IF-3
MAHLDIPKARINHQIRTPEVFLIGPDGEPIGNTKTSEALNMASQSGMDLIEISAKGNTPVCRIMDYGKYKYEQQKKAKAIRQKQVIVETKQVQIRPATDHNDLVTKSNQIKSWFEEGHKVQIICKFRGRELEYRNLGEQIIQQLLSLVGQHKVDQALKANEKQLIMTIVRP